MRDFNRFFNAILENPLLRSHEIIEDFMTKNQEIFHYIKLKYKNVNKLIKLTDFHTLNGELDVSYYTSEILAPKNILTNLDNKRKILKEINTNLKNVITCFDNMKKYMENLSKLFFDLKREYQYKECKFESFDTLARLCKSFASFYPDKNTILGEKVREFLKYMNSELKELKNLCYDSEYAKINLEKFENIVINLEKGKTNNLKNEDIYNYELQKKKIEKNLAQRTCNFLRNRTFEEFERITRCQWLRTDKYFSGLALLISDLIQKESLNSIQIIKCFNPFDIKNS